MAELTVPTFVKGEPGFAAKLNELAAVVIALSKEVETLAETIKVLKAATPAKATATRKATANA